MGRINNYCRCRAFCLEDLARTGRTCKLARRRSPAAEVIRALYRPKVIQNKRRNKVPAIEETE